MYGKNDLRASLVPAAAKAPAVRTPFKPASYARFYQEPPVDNDANGQGWYCRGQNMVVNYIAARAGGRIAMVGIVGGMGSIDYQHMLPINHKVLTLFANGMGSRRDLEDMLRFVDVNGIKPVIDSVHGFDEVADAFRHFGSRGHVGKVVITQVG